MLQLIQFLIRPRLNAIDVVGLMSTLAAGKAHGLLVGLGVLFGSMFLSVLVTVLFEKRGPGTDNDSIQKVFK